MRVIRRFMHCLMMVFLVAAAGAEVAELQSSRPSLEQGNVAFSQATELSLTQPAKAQELYQQAALIFQKHLDDAPSAGLHTNLGNCYFFLGENGYAALNYQRALGVDPTYHPATKSLSYLRAVTIDELPASTAQEIKRWAFFWHRSSFRARLLFFMLSNVLFAVLLGILLYRKSRWLVGGVLAVGVVSSVLLGSLLTSRLRWDSNVDGVIVAHEVVARKGNGAIYENAFLSPLHAGTEFHLLERRGRWVKGQLLDGETCWLPVNAVEMVRE